MSPVVELSRNDILKRIEQGARQRRGLSAEGLIRLYRAGKLEDPCEVADLLALADLLPDNDPLLVGAA